MAYPRVSVIIVTYNNEHIIDKCLSAVLENYYPDYEVIIIDNASTDKTLEVMKELITKYNAQARVKIVKNPKNYGISKASNIGALLANGKYLAFLDSDGIPDPYWLFQPIELMEKDPSIGAVQAKTLGWGSRNVIDSAGGLVDIKGDNYTRGYREIDVGQYDRIDEIFYPIGTGTIIRRQVFFEAGGFDNDMFIGCHDVDLGWRLWISGYKVVFAPASVVYHLRGGSRKKEAWMRITAIGIKSCLLARFKNAETHMLIMKMLTLYVLGILRNIFAKQHTLRVEAFLNLGAILWILKNFRKVLDKRYKTQRMRKVSENRIMLKCTCYVYSRIKLRWIYGLFDRKVFSICGTYQTS